MLKKIAYGFYKSGGGWTMYLGIPPFNRFDITSTEIVLRITWVVPSVYQLRFCTATLQPNYRPSLSRLSKPIWHRSRAARESN